MYNFHVKICLRSPFAGDIWSTSNFQINRANVNTLTKSSLYTNEVTEAALRCTLDTTDRFQKRLSPRPLDYSNINVKVCQLRTVHMGGGTGHLPGRDVCRGRTFAGTASLPRWQVCRYCLWRDNGLKKTNRYIMMFGLSFFWYIIPNLWFLIKEERWADRPS